VSLEFLELEKGSIFTASIDNIRIGGNIFHIYASISWKIFPSINTDKGKRGRVMQNLIKITRYDPHFNFC
jgi:hypothetical protein